MSCRVVGLDGKSYPAGTIVTSEAEKRAMSMSNDDTCVTYERLDNSTDMGAIHLYTKEEGVWMRSLSRHYGTWVAFATTITASATEVEVVENTPEAVEMVVRWRNWALNVPYLNNNGIVSKDYAGSLIFPEGATGLQYKYITNIAELNINLRIEKGRKGVFIGYHTIPTIGPSRYALENNMAVHNEETSYGERELGTGGGSSFVWSSAGHVSRFPAWAQDSKWATAEASAGVFENHFAWIGIDDPTYGRFGQAPFIATQDAGYPKIQAKAPWWVADYGPDYGVVRVILMRKPIETGVWSYAPHTEKGAVVCHFVNEWPMPSGRAYPFQIFLTAFKYSPDATSAYINEPSVSVRNKIYSLVSTHSWPQEPVGKWD